MPFVASLLTRYTVFVGAAGTVAAKFFGPHWFLFVVFLVLNILDWLSALLQERLVGVKSDKAGVKGVVRKLGYWLLILLGFLIGAMILEIGQLFEFEIKGTDLLGWFVVSTLSITEIRSIFENFINAGYSVPSVLLKVLAMTEKRLDEVEGTDETVALEEPKHAEDTDADS